MAADRTPTGGRNDLNAMCGNSIEASRRTADNLSVKDPKSGHFTESQKVNSLFSSLSHTPQPSAGASHQGLGR
jgi:hypothetical protein